MARARAKWISVLRMQWWRLDSRQRAELIARRRK